MVDRIREIDGGFQGTVEAFNQVKEQLRMNQSD